MRRLYLELKNLRFYYYVPPVILFILVPLTVLATIKSGGDFPECRLIAQLFIPSFAAWWPLFILKEYLNSAGKELLFVHKSGRDSLLILMPAAQVNPRLLPSSRLFFSMAATRLKRVCTKTVFDVYQASCPF